jgi:hypothetical protein
MANKGPGLFQSLLPPPAAQTLPKVGSSPEKQNPSGGDATPSLAATSASKKVAATSLPKAASTFLPPSQVAATFSPAGEVGGKGGASRGEVGGKGGALQAKGHAEDAKTSIYAPKPVLAKKSAAGDAQSRGAAAARAAAAAKLVGAAAGGAGRRCVKGSLLWQSVGSCL